MDAAGSERAALFGVSEGGPLSLMFAATYPERTVALVLCGCYARRAWAPDFPWGRTDEELRELIEIFERDWGGPVAPGYFAPGLADDPQFLEQWATYLRMAASPGAAVAIQRMNQDLDARHLLPAIRVPTLIVHRTGDRVARIDNARYLAERIHGAKLLELPGDDHGPFAGDTEPILSAVEAFLTGPKPTTEPDRVLTTVLTISAPVAQLDRLRVSMRSQVDTFRGRSVATTSGGHVATFDGPARAIRCAAAIVESIWPDSVEVSCGLHTGEVELLDDEVRGVPVRIAAELALSAGPGEVLVSNTVRDLVAGSGLRFEERGARAFAGLPDEWRVYAVDRASVAL
jgi:hypothetical protein